VTWRTATGDKKAFKGSALRRPAILVGAGRGVWQAGMHPARRGIDTG
jgi:hypothetical protein